MSIKNERECVLGIQLSTCGQVELLDAIGQGIKMESKMIVLSGNVHSFNLAYRQPWLRNFFNRADIVRLDGAGVRLGAWILGYRTPSRMTWADFAWDLAEFAEPRGFTFFFLGARPGVADKAAVNLKARYPDLRVVGTHHGYFDKTPGSAENEAVIEQINAVKPNFLIVGFGMPLQERWLMENWDRIDANVALTGGAVFDYVSGELQRAPRWMTENGLEWLGRLLIEPRRLWKRYLIGNPLFIWRVLKQRLGLLRFDEDAAP
jgi:N-acetylglucosaminyldiphosphoundecaprenol N-acetyl-beta-D-mannosaminyltransferase